MKPVIVPIYLCLLTLTACGYNGDSTRDSVKEPVSLQARVSRSDFGVTTAGENVEQYTIRNENGLELQVITYGGIIRTLRIPDRENNFTDVVMGFEDLKSYEEKSPYFGAIIGRYGNRIAGGKFSLDGKEYTLATNNGPNHLHGGPKGFDKVIWQAQSFESDTSAGIRLTYRSANMEEGYPGALDVSVTYTLDDGDRLIFDYKATTDAPTIVNLTNHAYYNLTGMERDVLGHKLEINADRFLAVDSVLIPEEPIVVAGTPFDFRKPTAIGARIDEDHPQLIHGGGYDHCWILDPPGDQPAFAASLYDPESGRLMKLYTTEPGIQVYSGNFLDGSFTGKEGITYNYRDAICLETQHFPDSPNRPEFPDVILRPGETYSSQTITVFSTRD